MAMQTFEGRSAAEAAIKACEKFGCSRSELPYQLLSEEGEGLDRRVVIEVDDAKLPKQNSSRSSSRANDGTMPEEGEEPPKRRERSDRGEGADRPRGRRGGGRDRDRGERGGGERGARGGRGGRGGRGRGGERPDRGGRGRDRDRGGRRGGRGAPGEDDGIEKLLNLETVPSDGYEARPALTNDASPRGTKATAVLGDIAKHLRFALEAIRVQDDEEEIHFDLRGDDVGKIIGKKGEVLLALQFLVNRIVDRSEEEGEQHIVLDAAGYRHRRRTALGELAVKLADRAIEEGKVVRLSPMSAHDRRIFHITLQEKEGISTRSQGGGLYRPLLIIPDVDGEDGEEYDEDE